jgi:hypothetical protein
MQDFPTVISGSGKGASIPLKINFKPFERGFPPILLSTCRMKMMKADETGVTAK